jgi:hypothetical protein
MQVDKERFARYAGVGCSIAFYKDTSEVRFQIACQTAAAYQESGIPLIVVSGCHQDPGVKSGLEAHGAIVIAEEPPGGLAGAYMQALRYAVDNGAEHVISHELEKVGIGRQANEIFHILKCGWKLVVIGRTKEALETLPYTQRFTETFAGEALRRELYFPEDGFSGGRAGTRSAVEKYLLHYDLASGNDWRFLFHPFLDAMKDGVPVGGILLDLMHPPEMVAEEENATFDEKRYRQCFGVLTSLLTTYRQWNLALK